MKKLLLSIAIFFFAFGAHTPSQAQQGVEIYVVTFRADWCGPCKIVEPNLARALNKLKDPSILPVLIDISDTARSEHSANAAFDYNIAKQYNQWFGTTGFAAIIDADTKQTLGCVNMMYDADAMAAHIKNLKTYAMANQPTFDITCPA
ncbi:MAG: thioredoxin domain-containing protein [Robiginitomaculum sp.]